MSRFARLLLIIVAVAFGIRCAYVGVAKRGSCAVTLGSKVVSIASSKCLRGDEVFYAYEADRVAEGHGFTEPLGAFTHPEHPNAPAADHPPVTVVVLASVAWLFDHPPVSWISADASHGTVREYRYTMVLAGTLLVGLVGLVGRRIGGDNVGLVAAGIAALSPTVWVNDGLVMSESLTALVVVAALWAAFALRDRPNAWRAVALGALCGLASLTRAEFVLLIPLLGFVIPLTLSMSWRSRLALVGAGLAATLVVMTPWVAYNEARFHDATFISTNDGLTLLGANCDATYYGPSAGLWLPTQCGEAIAPAGDQSQVSSAFRTRAIDYMRGHMSRLPIVVLARVGRLWSLYRPADMIAYNQGEDREPWVTRLGLVAFYPTLLAAIGGVVILWRRRARLTLWVVGVPIVIVTVNAMVTYGQTRFRAPAEPSLALLAAVAIVAVSNRITTTTAARSPAPAT